MSHVPSRPLAAHLAASLLLAALGAPAPVLAEGCDDVDCGKNAAALNGLPFREFHTGGQPNEDGFRVYNFSKDGKYYNLAVENGEFRGLDAQGNVAFSGADVVGSSFMVTNGTDSWDLRFAEYKGGVRYWVGLPSEPGISSYRMVYRPRGRQEWHDLCPDPASVRQDPGWLGPLGYEAFVFLIEGERYDPKAITVRRDVPTEGWVTIPCAGLALAKMKLMRYDPSIPPEDPDYHTTWQERQATLKMLTADVCGIGNPFTVTGQPLRWADSKGRHIVETGEVATVEAVWTEKGALCLDTPRLTGHPDYPNILSEIQGTCGVLPSCSEETMSPWTTLGTWKTYNPLLETP